MGYDLFIRDSGDFEASYDEAYVYLRGWEYTELAELLCRFGSGESCFGHEVEIPVHDIAFLVDVDEQVRDNPLFDYMEKLYELSEMFYWEFLESLSVEVRSTLRMSYHMDGLNYRQRELLSWIAEHDDEEPYKVIHVLARGVQRMLDDGKDSVYVIGL